MYVQVNLPENISQTFEIDSPSFRLRIGDPVEPKTVIGRDFRTGEIIRANCWGHIIGIRRNPLNHHLLVGVSGSSELRWSHIPAPEKTVNGIKS